MMALFKTWCFQMVGYNQTQIHFVRCGVGFLSLGLSWDKRQGLAGCNSLAELGYC